MPINKLEQQFFTLLAEREKRNKSNPLNKISVDELRKGASLFLEFGGETPNVETENRYITARDGYRIPVRIFNSDITTNGPVLVMYPGGGYFLDEFEANAIVCARIAKYSGTKVILVNLRLIPENPFPIPVFDGIDATRYIAQHANEFQLDKNKLVIGGFSAGAHCAAIISALSQNDKKLNINHQILLNGAYDPSLTTRPYSEYESKDQMVSREVTKYIYNLWRTSNDTINSLEYSPYHHEHISQLPNTTIIVGEYDGMRSDSENYFQKLKLNGCQVSKIVLEGQCHHTILLHGAMPNVKDPAKVIADLMLSKGKTPFQ